MYTTALCLHCSVRLLLFFSIVCYDLHEIWLLFLRIEVVNSLRGQSFTESLVKTCSRPLLSGDAGLRSNARLEVFYSPGESRYDLRLHRVRNWIDLMVYSSMIQHGEVLGGYVMVPREASILSRFGERGKWKR